MPSNQPIILLKEIGGIRFLPIWVGSVEATAIAFAQQGLTPPRPLTHDLIVNLLKSLEVELQTIHLTELRDGIFYATLNLSGRVAAWNLTTKKMSAVITTGKAARSLAISSDGSALFVVNFESGTVSKVRARDMKILQSIKVCKEPIGVTYDAPTSRTWVACYDGSIKVFDNN